MRIAGNDWHGDWRGCGRQRACLLAAVAALGGGEADAQEAEIALPTLTIEGGANTGFFGELFAETSGTVMKTDDPIVDTPRSVSVVTQQQMQDRGARSVTQALQYVPGVYSGNYGLDNRGDWSLVRGFAPASFEDGLQAQFGYYNNTKPEAFLLDSVSVLKGPSGMLYGNGSVGGIVNTSSKLPDPNAPNIVQLDFGTNDLFQANLDMGGELGSDGKLRYRLVAMGRSADGQIDFTSDDAGAVMPSLTWTPDEDTAFTVLALYQKVETSPMIQFYSLYGTLYSARPFANGDFLPPDAFIGEPDFDSYDAEQQSVTLFGTHRFTDVWSVTGTLRYLASSASYQQAYWAYDNLETGRYNPDGTINRTAEAADNDSHSWVGDLHASADFALGSTQHAAMLGVAFTDGRFNYDWGYAETGGPIDPFDPHYTGVGKATIVDYPEMELKQQSIYAQDQITWDRVTVQIGGRYDWIVSDAQTWNPADPTQRLKDGAFSGSAALLYAFDNGMVPYLSYSESFEQEATGTDLAGNAFLPTRGSQYEAGVKYQPPGSRSLLTAAVFEITKSNLLQPDPDNPLFSVQTGEATVRGIELGAQAEWRGFSVDAGYSYLDTEDADGERFAGVPQNQGSVWLQYAASDGLSGLSGGIGVRYVGAMASGDVMTPDFTLYDAMLAYEWDRYQVMLTGRNLADRTYLTSCDADSCYIGETRTIGLSLTARF